MGCERESRVLSLCLDDSCLGLSSEMRMEITSRLRVRELR